MFFSTSNWLIRQRFCWITTAFSWFTQLFVGRIALINLKISWSEYNQKYSLYNVYILTRLDFGPIKKEEDWEQPLTWPLFQTNHSKPSKGQSYIIWQTDLSLVWLQPVFHLFMMIKKWGKCSYNSDKLELFMMTLLWISISAEIENFL